MYTINTRQRPDLPRIGASGDKPRIAHGNGEKYYRRTRLCLPPMRLADRLRRQFRKITPRDTTVLLSPFNIITYMLLVTPNDYGKCDSLVFFFFW